MMQGRRRTLELKHELTRVAPEPLLARLEGANNRMPGRLRVLGGVPVLGVVAAAHIAAAHAQTEVHPPVSCPQAILAAVARRSYLPNLVEVRAGLSHRTRVRQAGIVH